MGLQCLFTCVLSRLCLYIVYIRRPIYHHWFRHVQVFLVMLNKTRADLEIRNSVLYILSVTAASHACPRWLFVSFIIALFWSVTWWCRTLVAWVTHMWLAPRKMCATSTHNTVAQAVLLWFCLRAVVLAMPPFILFDVAMCSHFVILSHSGFDWCGRACLSPLLIFLCVWEKQNWQKPVW